LGDFLFLALMNNAAVEFMCKFFYKHVFSSLGYVPGSRIANFVLNSSFWRTARLLS
jgi:hypothetical protein